MGLQLHKGGVYVGVAPPRSDTYSLKRGPETQALRVIGALTNEAAAPTFSLALDVNIPRQKGDLRLLK